MKTIAFLLLLAAPVLAHATDVHLGDSRADVQSAVGTPQGQIQLGNKLVLVYDRGQVQLVDDKVTGSNLITPEAYAAKLAQHAAEGQALKAQKLADPDFISASPGVQLLFWQDFRVRYPEVSCDDEYNLALARWQADQEQIAEQAKMIAAQQQQVAAQPPSSAPTAQDIQATAPPPIAEPSQPQQQCYDQPRQFQPDQPTQCVAEQQPAAQPQPVDVQPPSPPDSVSGGSSPTSAGPVLLPFPIMHR